MIKKIMLSIISIFTVAVASVIGFACFKPQKSTIGGGHYQNSVEDTNTLHFSEGEVAIQKGSSNLNYKYEPSTNARGRTVAFEYAFHNPMPNVTQAISLKSIDNTGVTLSYAYSTSKLTSITSSNTKFETQEVAPDGSRYIYILVTLSIAMPTDFQSKVVWNQGLLGSATIHDMDGNTYTTKIVKGQELKDYLAPSSIALNAYGAEWYSDADYENTLTTTQGGDVYLRVPNLPTDYLALDTSADAYYVKRGTSSVPNKLVIPARYNGKNVTYTENVSVKENSPFWGTQISSVSIPNTMHTIGNFAFRDCYWLNNVRFPSSVTMLGSGAFQSTCLKSLFIPKTLTGIYSSNAFHGCSQWLETIVVEEGNPTYDSRDNCNAIIHTASNLLVQGSKNTTFPTSIVQIGGYSFWNCAIEGLDLSACNKLTTIHEYAFYGCSKINNIVLPKSFNQLDGGGIFSNCTGLVTADLSACTSLTSIGNSMFTGCSALTTVNLPTSIKTIGYSAFSDCSALIDINLEDCTSLTSIGEKAFYYCENLNTIKFPDSLTTIGIYAFYNCQNLQTLTISKNVTSIDCTSFGLCYGLTTIIVDEQNTVYDSRNNCNAIMITATDALLKGCDNTIIPTETARIEEMAFDACKNINIDFTKLVNLTFIGAYAFSNTRMVDIDLSKCNKLTTIDYYVFYGCMVENVIIPSSVISIGTKAFINCIALTSLTIQGADADTWYCTTDWNFVGGTEIDLTNPSNNAIYFVTTYVDYCWYKK